MHCAQCGRLLPSDTAICSHCDRELALAPPSIFEREERDPRSVPDEGPHRCPACLLHFHHCNAQLHPAQARWYQPQHLRSGCPHCGVALSWLCTPVPGLVEQRLRLLAFLTFTLGAVLVFMHSKQWLDKPWSAALWFFSYSGMLYLGFKIRNGMGLSLPSKHNGQWQLYSEVSTFASRVFGMPPWRLMLLYAIALLVMSTYLPDGLAPAVALVGMVSGIALALAAAQQRRKAQRLQQNLGAPSA